MPLASPVTSSSVLKRVLAPLRTLLTSDSCRPVSVERKSTTGTIGTFAAPAGIRDGDGLGPTGDAEAEAEAPGLSGAPEACLEGEGLVPGLPNVRGKYVPLANVAARATATSPMTTASGVRFTGSIVTRRKKAPSGRGTGRGGSEVADPTGFEPAISSVTGWHVGPLHHGSSAARAGYQVTGRLSPPERARRDLDPAGPTASSPILGVPCP